MENQFGYEKEGDEIGEYIGQYVILFPQHSSTFSGKLIKIRNGYATLKPHQAAEYDSEKGLIRKIINKSSKVRVSDIVGIEPITRKSLENYCKYENKMQEIRARENLVDKK